MTNDYKYVGTYCFVEIVCVYVSPKNLNTNAWKYFSLNLVGMWHYMFQYGNNINIIMCVVHAHPGPQRI